MKGWLFLLTAIALWLRIQGSNLATMFTQWPDLQQAVVTSDRILQMLGKIYEEQDPTLKNRTISEFLESDPMNAFLVISNHVDKVISAQSDKTTADEAAKRLFGIVHALSVSFVFQQSLKESHESQSSEDKNTNLDSWEKILQIITTKKDRALQQFCVPATLQPGAFEIEEDCKNDGLGEFNTQTRDLDFSDISKSDGMEYVKLGVKTMVGVIAAFPSVGSISGIVSPFMDFLMKGEDKNAIMIQRGFHQINFKIEESTAKMFMELKLDTVKKVEEKASNLVQNLEEIYKETDPIHKNQTIINFLKQCEKNDPFQSILDLNGQIGEVLTTLWNIDSHHSKAKINIMKERLFRSLNKLTMVFLHQHRLRVDFLNVTIKERDNYINQLDRKLKEMEVHITRVLNELSQRDSFTGMKKAMEELMMGPAPEISEASKIVEEYVRDIYTSDKFCVITHRKFKQVLGSGVAEDILINIFHPSWIPNPIPNRHHWPQPPNVIGGGENVFTFENTQYIIKIVRSRTAKDTDTKSFQEKVSNVQDRCEKRDHWKECLQETPPFTIILKELKYSPLDNLPVAANIVRCKMEPAVMMNIHRESDSQVLALAP